MPEGVFANMASTMAMQEPSRLDMMRFTFARAMQSKTTSSGAFSFSSKRSATP